MNRAARTTRPVALESADERGTPFEIVTPEGVPLSVRIAGPADRATAFVLDALFLLLVVVAMALLAALAGALDGALTGAVVVLGSFLLRNFYFTWYEVRRGATPGKRRVGIRVIDARGGALTFESVLARNLMREVEVFLPLVVVFGHEVLWPGTPGIVRLFGGLWAVLLATMPLWNRRRLRAGDMVGGTLVVRQPKAVLLRDVVATGVPARPPTAPARGAAPPVAPAAPEFAFTDAQLDVYGNYELQVLEEVLRGSDDRVASREARDVVAERIRAKIGWERRVPADRNDAFLRAFYAALRARLEHRLLLGRGKPDKHAK